MGGSHYFPVCPSERTTARQTAPRIDLVFQSAPQSESSPSPAQLPAQPSPVQPRSAHAPAAKSTWPGGPTLDRHATVKAVLVRRRSSVDSHRTRLLRFTARIPVKSETKFTVRPAASKEITAPTPAVDDKRKRKAACLRASSAEKAPRKVATHRIRRPVL